MKSYLPTLLLTIVGVVGYNLAAKTVPREVNPLFLLAVVYAIAALICVGVGFFFQGGLLAAVRQINLPMLGLALSVAVIEVGYVLTYRAGGQVSNLPILVSAGAMLALMPLSTLLFGEQISAKTVAGVALCIAGLWLASGG